MLLNFDRSEISSSLRHRITKAAKTVDFPLILDFPRRFRLCVEFVAEDFFEFSQSYLLLYFDSGHNHFLLLFSLLYDLMQDKNICVHQGVN